MPFRQFMAMRRSMPGVKALEAIHQLNVADFPHLTQEGREKVIDKYLDAIAPERRNRLPDYLKQPIQGLETFTPGQASSILSRR